MRETLFISFYTDNKPYNIYIKNLENSLKKFELNYEIAKKTPGSVGKKWGNIICYKPKFILEMMKKHPNKKICWVDCDSVIIQKPNEILNNKYEISSIFFNTIDKKNFNKAWNCLILLENNPKTIKFMEVWNKKAVDYGQKCKIPDQDTFFDTYKEVNNINYGNLSSLKYGWISVTTSGNNLLTKNIYNHVIITQFQASRLKNDSDSDDIQYKNMKNVNFNLYPLTLKLKKNKDIYEISGDGLIWTLHKFFKELNGTINNGNTTFTYDPTDKILEILPNTKFN